MNRRRNRHPRTAYVVGAAGDGTRARPDPTLPYGAHLLGEHGFDVTYTDPPAARLAQWPPTKLIMRAVHRLLGRPVLAPVLEPIKLLRADLLVCMFEVNIAVLASLVRLRKRERRSVLVVCWLADEVSRMPPRQRRRWRRRLMAFDRVLVFSSNQISILERELRVPHGLVRMIPFGVDVPPLDEVALDNAPAGVGVGLILSVGSDRGRDFATFAAAVRGIEAPAMIITSGTPAGVDAAPGAVTVVGPVSRQAYLAALRNAEIVVSPTVPTAYPSGQTVLLEAMTLGKPCVVTRNPALAEYVCDGVDVLQVPPGDPAALRTAVDKLLADPDLRTSLAEAARRTGAGFTERRMWAALVEASDG